MDASTDNGRELVVDFDFLTEDDAHQQQELSAEDAAQDRVEVRDSNHYSTLIICTHGIHLRVLFN